MGGLEYVGGGGGGGGPFPLCGGRGVLSRESARPKPQLQMRRGTSQQADPEHRLYFYEASFCS